MKQRSDQDQWNKEQIEVHLKSAVDALTPDIFDRLDLSVPQENGKPEAEKKEPEKRETFLFLHQMRGAALGAAASLCLLITGGGVWYYQYENRQIDSVIGIDVNPSVELSINRRERVLKAEALNQDGNQILSDMDLKGVDLNVAVNAVVGSMVTHGYLDDLDNAILVTVSNDSMTRASALRSSVVGNIEKTLEENQVQAVVYDQQAVEDDEIEKLAEQYGISYGKAYFLKELIEENQDLSMEDMEWLSAITMKELAGWIGKDFPPSASETEVSRETEPGTAESPEMETETSAPETSQAESQEQTRAPEEEQKESSAEGQNVITAPSPSEEREEEELVEIDYVDYEDGRIFVYFVTYVDWKNPTVLVKDEDGSRYAALVEETEKDECVIFADGLEGGRNYTFVLGGLRPRGESRASSVSGYFKVPEISDRLEEESEEEETSSEETEEAFKEEETLPKDTEASSEESGESSDGEISSGESETSGEPEGSSEEMEKLEN